MGIALPIGSYVATANQTLFFFVTPREALLRLESAIVRTYFAECIDATLDLNDAGSDLWL